MIRGVASLLLAARSARRPQRPGAAGGSPRSIVKAKLSCKQAKRKQATRKISQPQRKHAGRAERRCAAAQRQARSRPSAPDRPGARGPAAPARPRPPPATPTPERSATTRSRRPTSNPHALQVVSGEFFLNLSKGTVLSGPVRVEFNNAYAEDPHDLHLVRQDGTGPSYAFGTLEAGEIEAKTLNLSSRRLAAVLRPARARLSAA